MFGVNIVLVLVISFLFLGVIGEKDDKHRDHIAKALVCVTLLTIALNLIYK